MEQSIKHVAIIMDGNGRWAKSRFRPRFWGHVRGSHVVSEIVEEASDLGLESLTLYAFSNENWSRPSTEIKTLFKLLDKFLKKEKQRILANQICFRVIGDISDLPQSTKKKIEELTQLTAKASGLKLNFAFSYGSKQEIIQAVNSFIQKNPGSLIEQDSLEAELFAPDIPAIDLLIRTSGEQRLSNFLLWQVAYAELFFTQTFWPDFSKTEFRSIINEVLKRERRYGSLESKSTLDDVSQKALLAHAQFGKEENLEEKH